MVEPTAQRVLELPAGRLVYTDRGAGEPVVLLHGLSGSGRWWARNEAVLARRRRVLTVDFLGFGASRGNRFLLAEAATQVEALLDAVALPRAALVGHSMGGAVAISLAAAAPERVTALVLVDAAALPVAAGRLRRGAGFLRALALLPWDFYPVLVADTWRAGPLTVLRAARDVVRADLREAVARVRAPTLVVWGARDSAVPPAAGEELAAAIPGARLEIFPRAGHNPMWEEPARFNALVDEFLAGAEAR